MFLDMFGWVGGLALGICAIPQAWMSFRQGHSRGISWSFIMLWFFGEMATLIYVMLSYGVNILSAPLLVNYVFNTALVAVILKYKVEERPNAVH